VGDRVTIGKNVQICDSIIGNKCVISDGSQIKGSIIWSDTMVGRKVEICSAVLGSWCFVGEDAKIKEGSVLANRCRVKREGVIALESRLQPGQEV
jgi:NDP-sugar pyrophosphorylase family protein